MSATDRLDEIQARAGRASLAEAETSLRMDGFNMDEDYPEYGQGQLMNAYLLGSEDARTDVPALVAALRAVLDLHKAIPEEGFDVCERCSSTAGAGVAVSWPCLTVRVIENALKEGK